MLGIHDMVWKPLKTSDMVAQTSFDRRSPTSLGDL